MAKNKSDQPKIQETEGGGFGEYKEGVGGGHPFSKGDSNTRTTKANGKLREKENPSTMQARTADGRFTYKSVNGQQIDPKYGPSRGKTVNPVLTGGKNGVMIDDVKEQFGSESGSYWDKYKSKWYEKGGEIVSKDLKTKVAAEAVWEVAKEYNKELGEFKGESEVFSSKSGKKGKEEQAAAEKAKKEGKYQYVYKKDKAGEDAIKSYKKKVQEPKPAEEQPVAPAPEAPAPQPAPAPKAEPKAEYVSKYSDEEYQKVSDFFDAQAKANNWPEDKLGQIKAKFANLSPEKKEAQVDAWMNKGVNFGFDKK